MTREELREHCERQIKQFERAEKIMPVTLNDWRRYEEHKMVLELLEPEPCDDAVSRQAVFDMATTIQTDDCSGNEIMEVVYVDDIKVLPPVTPTRKVGKWIPCSERLPKVYEFVNCTCHSLIDDREDWVIETVYIPQSSGSSYSDWGNIPMLNDGKCEVIAWMHRNIPEPYKAEMESEE